ncbi:hypothetical protein HJG60_011973 [Phyllostomus discolor]|uniref:Uncharacterized protein n=1 Tax=Phyllostomus discolor TaxID=89673 RepID=A0A833ZLX4_9CHIR|nr:hypothetical protein HJG60_011973 [Phyllostomus discolor]
MGSVTWCPQDVALAGLEPGAFHRYLWSSLLVELSSSLEWELSLMSCPPHAFEHQVSFLFEQWRPLGEPLPYWRNRGSVLPALPRAKGVPLATGWAWRESRGWCVGWPPQCPNDCPQLVPVFSLKPGKVGDRKGRVCLPSQVFLLSLVSFLLKQTCASKNVNKNKSNDSQGFV